MLVALALSGLVTITYLTEGLVMVGSIAKRLSEVYLSSLLVQIR